MKVVVAGQNYWVQGGSDRVLIDQISILEDFGHTAIPFVSADSKNLPSRWSSYFPETVDLKSPDFGDVLNYIYSTGARRKIASLLDDQKPDMVHCHIYYGKLTSSIIAEIKKRGIPLVQTLHEYKLVCPVYKASRDDSECSSCGGFKFYNAFLNKCNKNSLLRSGVSMIESYVSLWNGSVSGFDKFIAVSDYMREKVVSMGAPPEKVVTIYNPIDTESVLPSYENNDYYLFFGRIERCKGIFTLLSAFLKLKRLRLCIVGSGELSQEVISFIQDNASNNIEYLGFKSGVELQELIKGAKCVVVPSISSETFGLTAAEAMAHGKPVIASNHGGLPEIVTHEFNGRLVEPGNVDDLIDALNWFEQNGYAINHMGKNARESVVTKFSRKKHYQNLLSLYDGLLR